MKHSLILTSAAYSLVLVLGTASALYPNPTAHDSLHMAHQELSRLARVNYTVFDVQPRRCPIGGIAPDGTPAMLTVIGGNFSDLEGVAQCWLSEHYCGWQFTLVHGYLNSTATIHNDTHASCPCPAAPFGGLHTVSLFPERPRAFSEDALQQVRASHYAMGVPVPDHPNPPAPPGYDPRVAECLVSNRSEADLMSYGGWSNPFQARASASLNYFPMMTVASSRYPFTTADAGEVLVKVDQEVRLQRLVVEISLVSTNGTVIPLVQSAEVFAGRTTSVAFDLSIVPEFTLGNLTSILREAVTGRMVVQTTTSRFNKAGAPLSSQVIIDQKSGVLLGDGNNKIALQGWYTGWSKFSAARIKQMATRAAYRGASGIFAAGYPGYATVVPEGTENISQAVILEQQALNDDRVNETIAFIRHCHSIGLWVVADLTVMWPLSCLVKDPPARPGPNAPGRAAVDVKKVEVQALIRALIALREVPGLLGYTMGSAGMYFQWSAYELYKLVKLYDPYHPLMFVAGGSGGAITSFATTDIVMPEEYSGPAGAAAGQLVISGYPNDWGVLGSYGAGTGGHGMLYANTYAMMMIMGSNNNAWFMENYINPAFPKVESNAAYHETQAIGTVAWQARTHPELQPTVVSVEPALQVFAKGWARPCNSSTQPCADHGTSSTGPVHPQSLQGCMLMIAVLNLGPMILANYSVVVEVPSACMCPEQVSLSRLFAGPSPEQLMGLSPSGRGFFQGDLEGFGTNVFAINCSRALEPLEPSATGAVTTQMIVNPSFEADLTRTPGVLEFVGKFQSFAEWRWTDHRCKYGAKQTGCSGNGGSILIGGQNPLMPSPEADIDTPFGTMRAEFGNAVSGLSSVKVINSEPDKAGVLLQLTRPGMQAGKSYIFSIFARVAPGTTLPLQVRYQDDACRRAIPNTCTISNATLVVAKTVEGGEWQELEASFQAMANSTAMLILQANLGLLWLDEAKLFEQ